jgi:hypothetical protein
MDGMKAGESAVVGPLSLDRSWMFNRERTRMSAKFEDMKQPERFIRGNPSAFQISRPFAFFRGSLFDAKFGERPDSK